MSLERSLLLAGLLCAALPSPPARAQDGPLRDLGRFQIDERLELHAVASRTLTWLTGTPEQNDYISVGRFANFFGFVKFRVSSAHSLTRSSSGQEAFSVLESEQRGAILELLGEQVEPFTKVAAARLRMNRMLDRLRSGEEVERAALVAAGEEYGAAEAELGRVLAVGLGRVAVTLDDAQRERLAELRARSIAGRGGKFRLPRDITRALPRGQDFDTQELWNLTSRLLTWVTGTEADNDFETVGKPSQHFGFVSLRVESGHAVRRGAIAQEVLGLLDDEQRRALDRVVAAEGAQFDAFLEARSALCRELEKALSGGTPNAARTAALGREMGRVEAEMTWGQALGILAVRDRMTDRQAQALLEMRARYTPAADAEAPAVDPALADTETPSLLAEQVARGRQLFAQCVLCHLPIASGVRAVGPSLDGIVGRPVASDPSYETYSPAMRAKGGSWTEAELLRFLASPRTAVPGTIMGFDGVPSASDRTALVAYLKSRGANREQEPSAVQQEPAPPRAAVSTPARRRGERPRTAGAPSAVGEPQRPNFVLLLSDDQDWAGLGFPMDPDEPRSKSDLVDTPHIASLAVDGARFPRGYAPSPVCSPTRASIQTGLTPARLRWTKAAPNVDGRSLEPPKSARHLDTEYRTIAEVLRAGGYATAHFGKWHLGGGGPEAHGYEVSDGDTGNQDAIPHKDPNPVDIFGMTERALAFMRDAEEADRPFFVQMSYHALHHPENARADSIARQRAAQPRANEKSIQRAALAEDLDEGVGRLLGFLDEAGLRASTFVVYMSDNGGGGGGGRGAVLAGGKGGLGEGGIRVPFCVTGPGVEPGAVIREPVVGFDLFPTFVELAGLEAPDELDGSSFASALRGGDATPTPRDLLFHFPHYQGKATPQSALIRGNQKLVLEYESGRAALYDLDQDTAEARDLAAAQPERAAELRAALLGLLEAHGADLPEGAGTGSAEKDGPATVPGPPEGPDPGERARPRRQRRR